MSRLCRGTDSVRVCEVQPFRAEGAAAAKAWRGRARPVRGAALYVGGGPGMPDARESDAPPPPGSDPFYPVSSFSVMSLQCSGLFPP